MARDYYETLGVRRDATAEEIKKAFRRIARETHPDANPGEPEAESRFRQAAEAYEVLSDPDRRRRYDRGDRIEIGDLFAGMGGIDDILRSVFGEGGLFGSAPPRPARGRDVLVHVDIELAEAVFGVEVPVRFNTRAICGSCNGSGAEPGTDHGTCPDCGGSGAVTVSRRSVFGSMTSVSTCPTCRGEGLIITTPCLNCAGSGAVSEEAVVRVEVPAGVTSGTRLRLSGRGESGGRAGPAGDLFVEVAVAPDPVFERIDDDLIVRPMLDMAEATLGTRLEVPLIEGGVTQIDVPQGTQPGTHFRVSGKGVNRLGRRGRGDLHVVVGVEIPQSLSPEEEKLLRRWADLRGERRDRPASAG
jgi:molecular chaperone DnaJ